MERELPCHHFTFWRGAPVNRTTINFQEYRLRPLVAVIFAGARALNGYNY